MDFIDQVKHNANGRDVVVFGTNNVALKCYYILKFNDVSPLLMSDSHKETPIIKGIKVQSCEILSKEKVFVIIVTNAKVCVNILKELGFNEDDYIVKTGGFAKYDCFWDGVFIGRFTPDFSVFDNCLGVHSRHNCIASIGRYCSFNGRASMNGNHTASRLAISHWFQRYVDEISNPDMVKNATKYLEAYNKITIGNDVWIGANVFINASKVKSIGNGAILGANAVINEDIPPYAIVLGVPGKVKKYRFTEEQIEILEHVKWWDWDDEMIKQNADCFRDINIFFERFK